MARCTTARAVEGGADLMSRVTSPTLSPVKESTGRVAASARSARRTETAAFVLPAECGAEEDKGGRKEVVEEERKGEEDEESERRRGEATAAPGIVPALQRWEGGGGEDDGSAAAASISLSTRPATPTGHKAHNERLHSNLSASTTWPVALLFLSDLAKLT